MPVSLSIKLDEAKLQKLKNGFEFFPKVFRREMRKAFINTSADIIKRAKMVHRFNSITNNLENATQSMVAKNGLGVKFFIDDQKARYGKYIHEGFKSWGRDPYLRTQVENNIGKLTDAVEKAIDTASKESGLNG
jgi:hypothetical protein